jgi:hypothetical protein
MAVDLVDHLAILAVAVRRLPSMGGANSRFFRSESYARIKKFARRSTQVPFRPFLADGRREFMQRLYVVLHGTTRGRFMPGGGWSPYLAFSTSELYADREFRRYYSLKLQILPLMYNWKW